MAQETHDRLPPAIVEYEREFATLTQAFDRDGAVAVEDFVRKRTKPYLGAFIRANGIDVPPRARKERIAAELSKHLSLRKTLLGLTS